MVFSLFELMQRAVDAVHSSEHETSKVGTFLHTREGEIAHANFWPPLIKDRIGTDVKIGNASGTVHAETACLLHAPFATKGGIMFSTDPSCPNCAKNMAEAGIKHLYIDHKGFEKYYAQKRMEDFESLTLPICRAAGINVTRVFRKEERLEPLVEVAPGYVPVDYAPAVIEEHTSIAHPLKEMPNATSAHTRSFASCKIKYGGKQGFYHVTVTIGPSLGMPDDGELDSAESKYNTLMQPINRLLMTAAREGFEILPDSVYSSRIPSSRELVNLIGAGITHLSIGDMNDARDEHGRRALEQLQAENILKIV